MSLEDYLPLPAELARSLRESLPGRPYIKIIPRDEEERRVPAYAAHHYEIAAYYPEMGQARLQRLAEALTVVPGVYIVMIYTGNKPLELARWPVRYQSIALWRPQVRALIAHPKDRP